MEKAAAILWLLQLWALLSIKCLAQLPENELTERCEKMSIRVVGATASSVSLSCNNINVTGRLMNIRWSFVNSTTLKSISIDGNKYRDDGNKLQVNRVVASDEGLYTCHFQQEKGGLIQPEQSIDAGCIYVLSRAQYLTCEPSEFCTCQEHISVRLLPRLPILFDTRITYADGGSLGFIQDILQLQLYRGTRAVGDLLYSCASAALNECESSDSITVVSGNTNRKYDIQLKLANSEGDDSGTYTIYVDVNNPSTGGQTSLALVKTFIVCEEVPLAIHFVHDTPAVRGNSVAIQFILNRPADNVRCRLASKGHKVIKDCSSGSVVFSDLPPGSYVVRVVADNGRNDRAIERRRFDITGDSSTCTVHLINDGVTVDGNRVLVEFAGTGTVQVFSCQLRGQDAFSCISPVELDGLEAGEHHLRITPRGCGMNKWLVATFTTVV